MSHLRAAACCLALAGPSGGCALSFPIAPLMEDVTASNSPVPFGRMLDEEDRRREKAALSTALDPQGDGATVRWANVKSTAVGAVTAVGRAYPADSRVCRAFHAVFAREAEHRTLDGTACTVAAGEWEIRAQVPERKRELERARQTASKG